MREAIDEGTQQFSAMTQQLHAPTVSVASIATGMATLLEWIPPVAGALSSIGGLVLLYFLIKHKRLQIKQAEKDLNN